MRIIWSVAATLLLSTPLLAQPLLFSEPTPLTTTRYVAESSNPFGARLVTNGVQPYLLWFDESKVRIVPVTADRRAGRPVADGAWTDAVWTGSHFVVVTNLGSRYVGRLVGADGEAIGEPFVVAEGAGGRPQLAFDGGRVLLLFGQQPLRTVALSRDGRPLEEPRNAPLEFPLTVDTDATARAGEILIAAAGRTIVTTASLKPDGSWTRSDRTVSDNVVRQIAIATSGVTQLTIWTNGDAPMQATYGPFGTIGDYTLAGTEGATRVDVTWDGKDYVYAYRIDSRIHFRYFNAPFPFASVESGLDSPVELLSLNGKTYVAYHARGGGEPLVVRDVQALAGGDAGAFAAASQHLEATAASNSSALFAWFEERNKLYVGIRTSTGAWYERQIPNQDADASLAASDGNGFAVIHTTFAQGWTATLLDPQGNIAAIGPRVQFIPTGIVWAGDAYVVVGLDAMQRVVASRLSLSGIVTQPLVLAQPRALREIDTVRVAAREGELLVVWTDIAYSPTHLSDVLGARVTPALLRLDTQSLLLAERTAQHPDVIWDGTRYVIAWRNMETNAVAYRTMRTNAAVSGITNIPAAPTTIPRLARVPGGVGIVAGDGKVVFLRDGADTVMQLGQPGREDGIAAIGSRVAYVQPLTRDEMPYHGALRLNVRIGDVVMPAPKPSAPRITRADHPAGSPGMIIEWTAPPEPVNGYRVEYRVDDGLWNELDFWFDARARQLVIRPWRAGGARYQFRVRAVNDAGFSTYSNHATVRTRKMRAVR